MEQTHKLSDSCQCFPLYCFHKYSLTCYLLTNKVGILLAIQDTQPAETWSSPIFRGSAVSKLHLYNILIQVSVPATLSSFKIFFLFAWRYFYSKLLYSQSDKHTKCKKSQYLRFLSGCQTSLENVPARKLLTKYCLLCPILIFCWLFPIMLGLPMLERHATNNSLYE